MSNPKATHAAANSTHAKTAERPVGPVTKNHPTKDANKVIKQMTALSTSVPDNVQNRDIILAKPLSQLHGAELAYRGLVEAKEWRSLQKKAAQLETPEASAQEAKFRQVQLKLVREKGAAKTPTGRGVRIQNGKEERVRKKLEAAKKRQSR